jgi:hypothetical protein
VFHVLLPLISPMLQQQMPMVLAWMVQLIVPPMPIVLAQIVLRMLMVPPMPIMV